MDPRTLDDLVGITRERLDDVALSRPKWTSESIARGLNEGQREAALRGRLLRDDTSAPTLITLLPNVASYALNRAFFEIIEVRDDEGERLGGLDRDALEAIDSRWRSRLCARPDLYTIETLPDERLRLRVVGVPSDTSVLQLEVYRLPYYEMQLEAGDEPEIAPRHHENLVDWAMYRCFNVRDSDNYDPKKAADHLAEFVRNFGERPDANVHRKQRETSSHTIRPRSF